MHWLVVSVEVIDEISLAGQQSTGVETADTSGNPIGGAFHCPGNGAAIRDVQVEV